MSEKKKKINFALKSFICISISIILIHSSIFSSQNSFIFNSLKPPDIKDTIWVYDTIFQYDTVYITETIHDTTFVYDTIKIPEYIDTFPSEKKHFFSNLDFNIPKLKHKPRYYIGTEISIFNSTQFLSQIKSENSEIFDLYKHSFNSFPGFSAGISFQINYQNLILQTGAYFTDFTEKFDFFKQFQIIDTSMFYNHFQNNRLIIDTIPYVDLDSLLQGDTIWKQYIDSTYFFYKDSTLITNFDTTQNTVSEKTINQISYFELPIIFGYQFDYKKFSITPKAGIIIGFRNSIKGKIIANNTDFKIVNLQNACSFPFISFSSFLSVNLKYKINKKTSFYFEPFFRNTLKPVYYNDFFTKRYFSYGFTFGIKFLL